MFEIHFYGSLHRLNHRRYLLHEWSSLLLCYALLFASRATILHFSVPNRQKWLFWDWNLLPLQVGLWTRILRNIQNGYQRSKLKKSKASSSIFEKVLALKDNTFLLHITYSGSFLVWGWLEWLYEHIWWLNFLQILGPLLLICCHINLDEVHEKPQMGSIFESSMKWSFLQATLPSNDNIKAGVCWDVYQNDLMTLIILFM